MGRTVVSNVGWRVRAKVKELTFEYHAVLSDLPEDLIATRDTSPIPKHICIAKSVVIPSPAAAWKWILSVF
jgi:hypothetical protein